jgi:hypothetical protein
MNPRILIDGIVRQTMILVAQLATAGGVRSPLAHIAGEVFLELAKELEQQGVTKKVSADMFGMALRTYQRQTERLARSATDRGRSLWEAIFDYIQKREFATRAEILRRFERDDEAMVRGVLRDFMESGVVLSTGTESTTSYRVTTPEEALRLDAARSKLALQALVWSVVFREQPVPLERLVEVCGMRRTEVEEALVSLSEQGRVERVEGGGSPVYGSLQLVLEPENAIGWEASVLDHFATVVRTIGQKLLLRSKATTAQDTGGSTYHFALYKGSPFERELVGELAAFRARMTTLRDRIDEDNREHGLDHCTLRIDAYYGQRILDDEEDSDDGKNGF